MAKNKPLKDEEYDSIDEIQTTLDRHTDKLSRIEAGLVSIKSEIASVSKAGEISFQDPIYAYWLKTEYFAK